MAVKGKTQVTVYVSPTTKRKFWKLCNKHGWKPQSKVDEAMKLFLEKNQNV
jgi:hypothetical protein